MIIWTELAVPQIPPGCNLRLVDQGDRVDCARRQRSAEYDQEGIKSKLQEMLPGGRDN
jgi:hypothetical protein